MPRSFRTRSGHRGEAWRRILSSLRIMSLLLFYLMGAAQANLDRTSITVNKYLWPLFHRLSFCMSTKSICHCSSRSRTNVGVVGKRVRRGCGAYNSTPIGESVMVAGFGKRPDPTQGPGFMGIFVSAWQRHEDPDTRSFQFSFFIVFHTHMNFFKTRSCYQSLYANGPPGLPSLSQTDSTTVDLSWRFNTWCHGSHRA